MNRAHQISVPDRVTRVMRLLTHAAEHHLPCPGNAEIARAVGGTGLATGAGCIALLEAMNLITVERGSNSRVVTINATGKRTAGRVGKPHFRVAGFIWTDDRDGKLMEAVSEGATFAEAADFVGEGCSARLATNRFEQLRLHMGPQAA